MEQQGSTPPTRGTGAHGLSDLDREPFDARMKAIGEHLAAIEALLDDAKSLDPAMRRTASRLHGPDEVDALKDVLEFASLHAELFGALADEDEGTDPNRFEVDVLLARLQNEQGLAAAAKRVSALQARLDDCALYTTQLVKPIALKVYGLARPFAQRISHGELLFRAKKFYGAPAAAAARNRARNVRSADGADRPSDDAGVRER
jgi:hypothetical protein